MTHLVDMQRDRPARRKEIVDAARAIAVELGWPAVTVRAIAARIGCSAPAIYQYFRDKDAVLDALSAEGQSALAGVLEDATRELRGPVKRLRALVAALWDFAVANRQLCAVMFGLDGIAAHRLSGHPAAAPSALVRACADLIAKREAPDDPADLADSIAALTHGFLSLALAGGFPGEEDRARSLLLAALDVQIRAVDRR